MILKKWSQQTDSNRRPAAYKAAALPTELCWQSNEVLLFYFTPLCQSRYKSILGIEPPYVF